MTSIMWFRRDLRLADNLALTAAATAGPVVGLFVIDPVLMRSSGAPRRQFLRKSLDSLNSSMDGALAIRVGDPAVVIPAMASEVGAADVFAAKDYGPYGQRRDIAVGRALAGAGVGWRRIGSPYAVDPGAVVKPDGSGYSVFTAFWNAWQRVPVERARDKVGDRADVKWERRPSDSVEWPDELVDPASIDLPTAGEDAAWARWLEFREQALEVYADGRDVPGIDGTSRLSTYLRWGVVHPRQLLAELDASAGAAAFRRELAWREFYADVLYRRPDSAWANLDRRYDAMIVDTDDQALGRFSEWQRGATGYPIVAAGMRQLAATGWMHNRVRMITASFLVKDLHLPWQWGARHFMDHLVDGDLASNNHGWQWVAGSGTDAAPYHRILSPYRQAERFDPDSAYVRQWVPELRAAHAGPLTSYPPPMVDHAIERVEALRRRGSIA